MESYPNPIKERSPEAIFNRLLKKKTAFINYNIKRMHDLIRNLSPQKRKLFKKIPFLLHINSINFPGYVDHPSCPYGIIGFHESAFWKLSLKLGGLNEKQITPYLSKRYHILGLYLMGSSGTLAQSEKSDFDYWVLVDTSICTERELGYLSEKFEKIKEWSRKTFAHEVNFFILDVNDIKKNRYKAVDGESSGTAQKTILKEEFYRTFILIAGLIPYWAVAPPGIDDDTYNKVIAMSLTQDQEKKSREIYIDLGNLTAVNKNECPGAILWQLHKSHFDPAKSLIKACLIAYFNFLPEKEPLPCDLIKSKFAESIFSGSLYDPYAIIFDTVTTFLDRRRYYEMAEKVREAIFLRLIGYLSPPENDASHPKRAIIEAYTTGWYWDEEKKKKFESYREWSEQEKSAYDQLLVNRISALYEIIVKHHKTLSGKSGMRPADFKNIRNRIAKYFRKEPGKLPRCSAHLSARSHALFLTVSPASLSETEKPLWIVMDESLSPKKGAGQTLFQAASFIEAAAWITANGLYQGDPDHILFQQKMDSLPAKYMRRLFLELHNFMPGTDPKNIDFLKPPAPRRMAIFIHQASHWDPNSFHGVECLIENGWGELFFHVKNLSHIETLDKKCYEIAQLTWSYKEKSGQGEFHHKIILTHRQNQNDVIKKIEDFITQFTKENNTPSCQE